MVAELGLQGQNASIILRIPSLLGKYHGFRPKGVLGLRLQVFVPVSVGVITRLALQQKELAIVGQRHVLHQLGQSFWVLIRETHNICCNSSSWSFSFPVQPSYPPSVALVWVQLPWI